MSGDVGDDLPVIVGFWDYAGDAIVVVDGDGAAVIECADTPGNQLIHLQCTPGGPCQVHRGSS